MNVNLNQPVGYAFLSFLRSGWECLGGPLLRPDWEGHWSVGEVASTLSAGTMNVRPFPIVPMLWVGTSLVALLRPA